MTPTSCACRGPAFLFACTRPRVTRSEIESVLGQGQLLSPVPFDMQVLCHLHFLPPETLHTLPFKSPGFLRFGATWQLVWGLPVWGECGWWVLWLGTLGCGLQVTTAAPPPLNRVRAHGCGPVRAGPAQESTTGKAYDPQLSVIHTDASGVVVHHLGICSLYHDLFFSILGFCL